MWYRFFQFRTFSKVLQQITILSNQINPKSGVPQDSVLSLLLFLIYVKDLPTPHHKQNSLSQFADDTAQWHVLQQNFCNRTFWTWQCGVPNGESNWILKSQGDHILQAHARQENRTQPKAVWRDTKSLSSSEISRYFFQLPTHFQKALIKVHFITNCNVRCHRLTLFSMGYF